MNITLTPKKVAKFFAIIVIFLTLAHVAGLFSIHVLNHKYLHGLIPLFNLGIEDNIPTLYASISLLFCSILFELIAFSVRKNDKKIFRYWLGLALIFLLMSIDESVSLHERLRTPLPIGIALIVFSFIYIKFLIQIPKEISILFAISGVLYTAGALGFEMLETFYASVNGKDNVVYSLIYTFEELFEMVAIVLLIFTLLSYIELKLNGFSISFSAVRSKLKNSLDNE